MAAKASAMKKSRTPKRTTSREAGGSVQAGRPARRLDPEPPPEGHNAARHPPVATKGPGLVIQPYLGSVGMGEVEAAATGPASPGRRAARTPLAITNTSAIS